MPYIFSICEHFRNPFVSGFYWMLGALEQVAYKRRYVVRLLFTVLVITVLLFVSVLYEYIYVKF